MLVGHLGAVEKMLDIITDKLQQGVSGAATMHIVNIAYHVSSPGHIQIVLCFTSHKKVYKILFFLLEL